MINMSLSEAMVATKSTLCGKDVVFSGCSTDSRIIEKGNLFIALKGNKFDGHDYTSRAEEKGAAALMLQETVAHKIATLKVNDTRKAMGLLARSWRDKMTTLVVAITGSNGKTTVKEMVARILSEVATVHVTKGNLNNDIGVPLTLFSLDKEHQYAVIEMGANHLGEIEWLSAITRPDVAVITQCAPAHLEGFGDIDGVARAKAEIYSGLRYPGVAIINADDDYADFWRAACSQKTQLTFGIESADADIRAQQITLFNSTASVQFELVNKTRSIDIRLPLSGRHNVMNALAASACCLSLNIPLSVIKRGLEGMRPVSQRLQIKKGKNDVRIIDDTYNANPASLSAALNVLAAYQGKRYLVLGDMGDLGSTAIALHRDVGIAARQAGIDGLLTIGELSINAMQAYGDGAFHFESYKALNKSLLELLMNDTTILIKGSRAMQMEQIVAVLTKEQS